MIINLLPVLDDFERAFGSLDSHLAGLSWFDGIHLIYRKLQQLLENAGVNGSRPKARRSTRASTRPSRTSKARRGR